VSIGEALAEARRQAGLTVTEVSQRTRIRETIISGIEADDYSACGGDFYARGHIRSIAAAVGVDSEPLIQEYDAARLGPEGIPEDVTEPVAPIRAREPFRLNWAVALALALALLVALGFLVYHFLAGSGHGTSSAPAAGAPAAASHRVSHRPSPSRSASPSASPSRSASPSASPSTPAAVPARALTPVSAAAFGPYSGGRGDDPQGAHLAIDGHPGTAWHTDWYTTARFGNLYPGTGLLVDMGRPVTITAAQLTLGRAPGADVQLRVGTAPALADLPPVARVSSAAGVVRLRLAPPAHGRYVLVWFTSLPPDPSGTFQASIYDLRLAGQG
jgi:cytoskeletal protein RodZ